MQISRGVKHVFSWKELSGFCFSRTGFYFRHRRSVSSYDTFSNLFHDVRFVTTPYHLDHRRNSFHAALGRRAEHYMRIWAVYNARAAVRVFERRQNEGCSGPVQRKSIKSSAQGDPAHVLHVQLACGNVRMSVARVSCVACRVLSPPKCPS